MFNAFQAIQAGELGRQHKEQRERKNAFATAGEAFGAGDYSGASQALLPHDLSAGMQMAQYGQQQNQMQAAQTKQSERQQAEGALALTDNMLQIPEAQRGEWLMQNWQSFSPYFDNKDFMSFWQESGGDVSDATLQREMATLRTQLGQGAPQAAGPLQIDGRLIDPNTYKTLYAPPQEREQVKGADGYLYYADTGERVLPGVRKPEPVRAPSDPWKMVATGDGNSVMYNSQTGESREFNKAPEFIAPGVVDGAQSGGFEDFESPFNADEFRSYNGGGADFIPASFTQGDVGGRYGQEGLDPAFVTGGQGTPTGRKPTEYDKVRDREMAKDLTEWTLGGQAQAASQLRRLKDVIQRLDRGENVSGPFVGNLPLKSITAPGAKDVQDTVASVVQQSLKAILGGQFAQQEAEQLLKRAYDPGLDEKLNSKRLKILYDELVYRSRMNDYAARYADQNGTLEGFDGYLPQIGDFFTTEQSAPKEIGDMSDDDLLRDLGLN